VTLQNYEDYWKITLEYTNFNSPRFIGTLKIIVDFINANKNNKYSQELYKSMQETIYSKFPKVDMGSVRKSINQCVKLGFVNTFLKSYPEETIEFLEARTNRIRKSTLSKIIYKYSSFNRSVVNDSNQREINFLIKTLERIGKLSSDDIIALMTISDLSKFPEGYLTEDELKKAKLNAEKIKFIKRKYNQVGYLKNILSKLDDLVFRKGDLYFEDDAEELFGKEFNEKGRDPYLQRIYKNQLKEEVSGKMGGVKCMLEKLEYPSLVGSHIKPFSVSNPKEAYDPDNGLLLSRNMDLLFDKGYISFKNNGKIIISRRLPKEVNQYLQRFFLDKEVINGKRSDYLMYHRAKVFH